MKRLANTRVAFGNALLELGKKNKNIIVMSADLSSSTYTNIFAKEFPERFFNTGVAEQSLMATAGGLATTGKIVFVSTFAVFASGRAYDQIRQSIAHPKMNVKIVATHGGISVGADGSSHQTTEDIAIMRVLPNMKVIVPADAIETDRAVRSVVDIDGPFYIRLSRGDTPLVYDDDYEFKFGKPVLLREGEDCTIFATGIMVYSAIEAHEILKKEGINAKVVNIHTIKPIDADAIINYAKKSKAVLTAEEHSIIGGLGSAIAEVLSQTHPVKMKIIGVNDCFGISGEPMELMERFGLTANDIVREVKTLVGDKK
ncbi:MAG: transketolase family protein [Candidatus Thermoplasmatota archaeon]